MLTSLQIAWAAMSIRYCRALRQVSVFEVPDTCKHHREAVLISRRDHFLVADGAAGLDDGGDPGACGLVDPVTKRKERIRRQHRTGEGQLRAHRANPHRVNTRHLSSTDTDGLIRARIDDRV